MFMTKFILVENLVSGKMEPETTGCTEIGMIFLSLGHYIEAHFHPIRKNALVNHNYDIRHQNYQMLIIDIKSQNYVTNYKLKMTSHNYEKNMP